MSLGGGGTKEDEQRGSKTGPANLQGNHRGTQQKEENNLQKKERREQKEKEEAANPLFSKIAMLLTTRRIALERIRTRGKKRSAQAAAIEEQ